MRPRTSRVVLWGHRGLDSSPFGRYTIEPGHWIIGTYPPFLDWLRSLGIDPDMTYSVELGQVGLIAHRWDPENPCESLPPLELAYGFAGPPPSPLDPIKRNANRTLSAFGVRERLR